MVDRDMTRNIYKHDQKHIQTPYTVYDLIVADFPAKNTVYIVYKYMYIYLYFYIYMANPQGHDV